MPSYISVRFKQVIFHIWTGVQRVIFILKRKRKVQYQAASMKSCCCSFVSHDLGRYSEGVLEVLHGSHVAWQE